MKNKVYQLTISALLIAIGILIPMISPKIVIPPASFTLGSHVAIYLAMLISPGTAVVVAIGTTLGFFWSGLSLVIVARAATHIIFATFGAFILKKNPAILTSARKIFLFAFGISCLHAFFEVMVVIPFYFGTNLMAAYNAKGFLISVVLLVGVGTIIHSLVDFGISLIIWKPLNKMVRR